MKNYRFKNLGGGAPLLTARSAIFGGVFWKKLLRYYDTKALRGNCRFSKSDLQSCGRKVSVILKCQSVSEQRLEGFAKAKTATPFIASEQERHDTLLVVGRHYYVDRKELNVLTSYRLNDFKKKAAFTLAEVLITIGIIGVVAAMTIPTLVANYKKKVVETRLVKVYSTFNQAIKMSEAEHGPLTTWDAIEETIEYDDENQSYIITESNIVDWYDKYIAPYIKTAKVDKNNTTSKDKKIKVWMPDGSLVLISGNSWLVYPNANDYSESEFGEDTGLTDRDKDGCGTKYFTFYFNPRTNSEYHYGKGLEPYLHYWDGTKEMLLEDDALGCKKESVSNERAYCTQLIRMNNWKIPDDYPLRF